MRIIHFIEGLQKAAGTTAFAGRVAEELARAGHRVTMVLRVFRPAEDYVPAGVEVVTWDSRAPLEVPADVVHIHGMWVPWIHRAFRWGERRGLPVVFSPHGSLAPWAMHHKWWKKWLPWRLWFRGHIARAAMIHVTADLEAAWVQQLGFARERLVTLPIGVDVPTQAASQVGEPKVLLFVGRIYPVKGLDLLLRAWAASSARARGWHLVCVGPNQAGYREVLEAQAQTLGLTAQRAPVDACGRADVTFTGPLFGAAKDAAYLAARGLILPSYTENFGSVVVDALAFGLPVLVSERTPWEHLPAQGCGARFALTLEAETLALNRFFEAGDAERQQMGARGRKWVNEVFQWRVLVRELAQKYEQCMATNEL